MKSDNESHGGFGEVVGEILGELIDAFPAIGKLGMKEGRTCVLGPMRTEILFRFL
jgi:hypothetical protein